jgi:hypothetical protein
MATNTTYGPDDDTASCFQNIVERAADGSQGGEGRGGVDSLVCVGDMDPSGQK